MLHRRPRQEDASWWHRHGGIVLVAAAAAFTAAFALLMRLVVSPSDQDQPAPSTLTSGETVPIVLAALGL